MSIKDSILAAALAAVLPFTSSAYANPETEPESAAVSEEVTESEDSAQYISPEEFVASLEFKTGRVVLGNDLATLNLPDSLVFLDGENAQRLLVDGWGNPPDDVPPLGMILPAGVSPLAEESWGVTVEYEDSGYVSDEDAADIDYGDMLKDMQADMREANTWREEKDVYKRQLLKKLRAVGQREGERLGIAPELMLRKKTLEALLKSGFPKGPYQLPDSLRGWRRELMGQALLDCLAAEGESA